MRDQNQNVKVIAIEAHPWNYWALCRNIRCNNFENRIKPINKAVLDCKGEIFLYERSHDGVKSDTGVYSVYNQELIEPSNFLQSGGKSIEVECDTLDNLLAHDQVNVMKIDIEGAEISALKGAATTLTKLRKILVEIHGDNLKDVQRMLTSHGFIVETITSIGQMTYVIGSRNSGNNSQV
jgi:FkbM family methyltransferase